MLRMHYDIHKAQVETMYQEMTFSMHGHSNSSEHDTATIGVRTYVLGFFKYYTSVIGRFDYNG